MPNDDLPPSGPRLSDRVPPLVIAHVVAPAPVGGLERVVQGLATGHAQRGHRVHVVNVFDRGEPVVPIPIVGNSTAVSHVIATPRRRYCAERRAVARLCASLGVQIVHTHGYRPDVVDSSVARGIGARRVTTMHGFLGGSRKTRLFEWLQTLHVRKFDAVVAVSRALVGRLAADGVPKSRLHWIPNAWTGSAQPLLSRWEARATLGMSHRGICIGWVGRLSHEKGADVLLEALALAGQVDWTIAIIGAGKEERALRERAQRLGVGHMVRWCGAVPEAARCYPAFDLFVLSSRTEGTPISLFEAMAASVPLVVTRVGGVPEVVTQDEALLVEPENPAALASAMRLALASGETAARVAAARSRLESAFAPGPWLDAYERLYRTLTSHAARASWQP